jgi:hypothetical protein
LFRCFVHTDCSFTHRLLFQCFVHTDCCFSVLYTQTVVSVFCTHRLNNSLCVQKTETTVCVYKTLKQQSVCTKHWNNSLCVKEQSVCTKHRNNSLCVNLSLHSDTLSWFWVNQSMIFLLLHALWRSNKYQCYSLWLDTFVSRTHDLPHSRGEGAGAIVAMKYFGWSCIVFSVWRQSSHLNTGCAKTCWF